MKQNVDVLRTMISSHPYNTWPLHVKAFTTEAHDAWKVAASGLKTSRSPLPPGFTITVELEGVDGKSGQPGTGRMGPIDVSDGKKPPLLARHVEALTSLSDNFSSSILNKNDQVLSNRDLICSVCQENLPHYSSVCDSLECTAL